MRGMPEPQAVQGDAAPGHRPNSVPPIRPRHSRTSATTSSVRRGSSRRSCADALVEADVRVSNRAADLGRRPVVAALPPTAGPRRGGRSAAVARPGVWPAGRPTGQLPAEVALRQLEDQSRGLLGDAAEVLGVSSRWRSPTGRPTSPCSRSSARPSCRSRCDLGWNTTVRRPGAGGVHPQDAAAPSSRSAVGGRRDARAARPPRARARRRRRPRRTGRRRCPGRWWRAGPRPGSARARPAPGAGVLERLDVVHATSMPAVPRTSCVPATPAAWAA
jgi:hypothetical protein